jgi:hypothetical protein
MMQQRYFTREEAEALLPQVTTLLTTIQEKRGELLEQEAALAELRRRMAGNGHGMQRQLIQVQQDLSRSVNALKALIADVHALGIQLKDLDMGLIDFPARRANNEEVLLCWRLGEPRIAYWHSLEGGFMGRRPIEEL